MNVGEMRKLIKDLPDDLRFFTIVGDHKARETGFSDWFITDMKLDTGRSHLGEFFGNDCLIDGEVRVRALVSNS